MRKVVDIEINVGGMEGWMRHDNAVAFLKDKATRSMHVLYEEDHAKLDDLLARVKPEYMGDIVTVQHRLDHRIEVLTDRMVADCDHRVIYDLWEEVFDEQCL